MLEAINLYHALSRSEFKVGMYKKALNYVRNLVKKPAYRLDSKTLGTL